MYSCSANESFTAPILQSQSPSRKEIVYTVDSTGHDAHKASQCVHAH